MKTYKKISKFKMKGGANGTDIPLLSPMQNPNSVKPLSDLGVTVGDVPFSTPEQLKCIEDKGVPKNLVKIMALRANNHCEKAYEIYDGGSRKQFQIAGDSWWPHGTGMSIGGGRRKTKRRKTKRRKTKRRKTKRRKLKIFKKIRY